MKKFFSYVISVMAVLFAACEEHNAPATSNKVETGAVSDITTESVVLHGKVNVDISQYDDVEFGMMVSEDKADLNARDGEMYKVKVLIGKDFELTLEGLSPETKYYYCAWLFLNNTQYEFGSIKDFETEALPDNPNNPLSKYMAKPFSVSPAKKVYFSPGNLQYHPANDEWRFAPNQWDYIGEENSNISSTYNGWLDLFGWSSDNPTTPFGVSTSVDLNDYRGTFVDWGINEIGTDAPNTWRTLTGGEWDYLQYSRTNTDALCGVAQVNGVNGLVFLPDNWTCPSGVTFKSGFHSERGADYYADYQTFTAAEWSKLESAGAVFLPAAGRREDSDVRGVRFTGYYWSSTEVNSGDAHCLYFYSGRAYLANNWRRDGYSVRLVKDLQ